MVRARIVLSFVLPLFGCATTASDPAPDVPERTLLGYQCSADRECGQDQRCFKRYPHSIGRCVHAAYYDREVRSCRTDADCETTEVCTRDSPSAKYGQCVDRFEESRTR